MFVSFLLPKVDRGSVPLFVWTMLKQMDSFAPNEIVFICDKQYTVKHDLPWGANFSTYAFEFHCPTWERFNEYQFYFLAEEIFEDAPSQPIALFKSLLTESNEKLKIKIAQIIDKTSSEKKIEAILTWCNCPTLTDVAHEKKIPIIHNELGPFRNPIYKATNYFDFQGVNGNTRCELESRQFFNEIKRKMITLPTLSTIQRTLLKHPFNKTLVPKNFQETGVALQVSDDSNIIAFSNGENTQSLLSHSKRMSKGGRISVRRHPLSQEVNIDDTFQIDQSPNSLSFVLGSKRVLTINSSIGAESLLWKRETHILGDSPYAFLTKEKTNSESYHAMLAYSLVGYTCPAALMYNKDYISWRLSKPSALAIFSRHLEYLNYL